MTGNESHICPDCGRPGETHSMYDPPRCPVVRLKWSVPDPTQWDTAQRFMSVPEALAAGVPREVIEESWRETDRLLGTNVADDLIRAHFGAATDDPPPAHPDSSSVGGAT